MKAQIRPALMTLLVFTLMTGVIYPLVVTGIAQLVFPHQANGSLIVRNGQVVGSELIGQPFDDPKVFLGTPLSHQSLPVQCCSLLRFQSRAE